MIVKIVKIYLGLSLVLLWVLWGQFVFGQFLGLTYISQEADQVFWYSHLFQNFLQFIVMHTVKGFGIVNKAEIDVFLELSCFFYDVITNTKKFELKIQSRDWNFKNTILKKRRKKKKQDDKNYKKYTYEVCLKKCLFFLPSNGRL